MTSGTAEFDTPWVLVASRILVDPTNPADVAAVNELQDGLKIQTASTADFVMPDYEKDSFGEGPRSATNPSNCTWAGSSHGFGKRSRVSIPRCTSLAPPTAGAGSPTREASYATIEPNLPVGDYEITVRDVPVDAFWSISVYNKAGFFEKNKEGHLQRQQRDRGDERRRVHHDQVRRRR